MYFSSFRAEFRVYRNFYRWMLLFSGSASVRRLATLELTLIMLAVIAVPAPCFQIVSLKSQMTGMAHADTSAPIPQGHIRWFGYYDLMDNRSYDGLPSARGDINLAWIAEQKADGVLNVLGQEALYLSECKQAGVNAIVALSWIFAGPGFTARPTAVWQANWQAATQVFRPFVEDGTVIAWYFYDEIAENAGPFHISPGVVSGELEKMTIQIRQSFPGVPIASICQPDVVTNRVLNPDGVDSFTLSFNGETTAPLTTSGLTAASVQSSLQGLSTIGQGNATVTEYEGIFTVTLALALLDTPEAPDLTARGTGGTATVSSWDLSSLDWIGLDNYTDPFDADLYQDYLSVLEHKFGKEMLVVPYAYSTEPLTAAIEEDRLQQASEYWNLAQHDPDVIGVIPFLYNSQPGLYGVDQMPEVQEQFLLEAAGGGLVSMAGLR